MHISAGGAGGGSVKDIEGKGAHPKSPRSTRRETGSEQGRAFRVGFLHVPAMLEEPGRAPAALLPCSSATASRTRFQRALGSRLLEAGVCILG